MSYIKDTIKLNKSKQDLHITRINKDTKMKYKTAYLKTQFTNSGHDSARKPQSKATDDEISQKYTNFIRDVILLIKSKQTSY